MTRPPASSSVQLPSYVRHDDHDVELVLVAAWLCNEYGLDKLSLAASIIAPLPITTQRDAMEHIAAELELAVRVEACTMRDEFEDLTGVHSRSLSLVEDVEAHAETVRADARILAEQLVGRVNHARLVFAS